MLFQLHREVYEATTEHKDTSLIGHFMWFQGRQSNGDRGSTNSMYLCTNALLIYCPWCALGTGSLICVSWHNYPVLVKAALVIVIEQNL